MKTEVDKLIETLLKLEVTLEAKWGRRENIRTELGSRDFKQLATVIASAVKVSGSNKAK